MEDLPSAPPDRQGDPDRESEPEEVEKYGPLGWTSRLRRGGDSLTLEELQAFTLLRLTRFTGWLLAIVALVVIANVVVGILIGVSLAQDSGGGLDPLCADFPVLC
ncbi:MAG TPA: hypothetical protein VFV02_00690 [Acidimicrobiales bacterium]|nr:hypothetical protein [Acidimicrobiales bacterium]